MMEYSFKLMTCVFFIILLSVILFYLIKDVITYGALENFDSALNVAETQNGYCTPENKMCIWQPDNTLTPNAQFSTSFDLGLRKPAVPARMGRR